MKKTFPLILTALALSSLAVRDSHAGLGIGALAGNAGTGALIGAGVGIVGTAGVIIYLESTNPSQGGLNGKDLLGLAIGLGGPVTLITTLLDVDAALPEHRLTELLQSRYPFVESTEAMSRVASAAKKKLVSIAESTPYADSVIVRFSRTELEELLSDTSLSAEDFDRIAHDLQ